MPDEPLDDEPELDGDAPQSGADESCHEAPGEAPPSPPQHPSKPSRERPSPPFFGRDLL